MTAFGSRNGQSDSCLQLFLFTVTASWGDMAASLRRPLVAVAVALLCCRCGVLSFPDPREREALIQLETSMQVGGQVVLTEAEKRLDAVLLKMKQQELTREDFPPAMHFFKARPLIEASPIFTLLRKMPKGAFRPQTSGAVF